jgi:hypothetical protein
MLFTKRPALPGYLKIHGDANVQMPRSRLTTLAPRASGLHIRIAAKSIINTPTIQLFQMLGVA